MEKYIKCKKCRSTNIAVIQDNRNDFGAGVTGYLCTKSIIGASIFANNQRSVFQCCDCGKVFKEIW